MQNSSGEDYLIVRILDAEYPPRVYISDEGHFTLFDIEMQLQIENPTQSVINGTYVCSPYPFPHLKTNLRNKSIEVSVGVVYEWLVGSFYILPGIKNETADFGMTIYHYEDEHLPLGEYEIWFDYTNCSYVSVPVITEKMFINVSETNITYIFEFSSETHVFTVERTNNAIMFIIASYFLLTMVIKLLNYRKKK